MEVDLQLSSDVTCVMKNNDGFYCRGAFVVLHWY